MARVLITDDEEMERVLLHSVLGDAGHELFFANEGQSALDAYEENDVDVVVTDIYMPGHDGMSLIEELLKWHSDACIVVVSGANEVVLKQAELAGALTTLSKPVDPGKLVEAVAEAAKVKEQRSDPWL